MKPAASIVIPTFNRAELVRAAIDSALEQSVPCEVIVCDHGSTDDTPSVARGYGSKIRYLRRNDDHGPFYCWLDGVIHASAELVHITYDDDWIAPQFIEKCMSVLPADAALAFTSYTVVDSNGAEMMRLPPTYLTGVHLARDLESALLKSDLTISPGCALMRRKTMIESISPSGVPLSEARYHGAGPDMLLFLMPLLNYARFGYVGEALAYFRAHDGSITIDSFASDEKSEAIREAYRGAKEYYLLAKANARYRLAKRLHSYWEVKQRWASLPSRVQTKMHSLFK